MTPRKPYNELLSEKLNNIPLPDEDKAWEEMKKLLDEDDRKRPLLPLFLRGCLPWVILGILLSIGVVIYFNFSDWNKEGSGDKLLNNKIVDKRPEFQHSGSTGSSPSDLKNKKENSTPGNSQLTGDSTSEFGISQDVLSTTRTNQSPSAGTGGQISRLSGTNEDINRGGSKTSKKTRQTSGKSKIKISNSSPVAEPGNKTDNISQFLNTMEPEEDPDYLITESATHNSDSTSSIDSLELSDTLIQKADTLLIKDTTGLVADSSEKKKKKSPFTFSAGLAINQGIPLNGEKTVPYDHYGRRSSIADYLPSVYARIQKPKWFIQGEFRYGTPQNVKEFVYRSKTDIDTFQTSITTTSSLKKTYYHQVPLTFHYNIMKNWSVGAGIAYNRFSKAVRQENVRLAIPGTTIDTLLESNIVTDGRDSAFVSHSFQWVVETQYKWKRVSFGLRFAQGLQPYIKYTDPLTGLPAEKKNMSLNAFLRFELVRSKKK